MLTLHVLEAPPHRLLGSAIIRVHQVPVGQPISRGLRHIVLRRARDAGTLKKQAYGGRTPKP